MNKDLAAAWKKAEESGEKIPIGNIVVCDQCDIDYTSRDDRGGIILGSNAFSPSCTPKMLAAVARHREEHYIRARRHAHQSFADFVRQSPIPEASVRITNIL